MKLGTEQARTLEWMAKRGGTVHAPPKDRVLMSLVARGLVTKGRTVDASPASLRDYGINPKLASRRWPTFTLTEAAR